jgi:hypothetical protein
MKTKKILSIIVGISWCGFAVFVPRAHATCRQGCGDPFENTFLGDDALVNNSTGGFNTACGAHALGSNGIGSDNTATGAYALYFNTSGYDNTASGYFTPYSNGTGSDNTASGYSALTANTTGIDNTASGSQALSYNTTGNYNTASGAVTLQHNTTGSNNTAGGYQALNQNTIGIDNVATGYQALLANTSGITNTAVGAFALVNSQTGAGNIAIGFNAGSGVTSGSNNIDIANNGANESSTIRIGSSNQTATFVAGIRGVGVAAGQPVAVSVSGQLGVRASSVRFKEAIKSMDNASEAILRLKPVTFRYKKKLDPKNAPQFGLVAEEVAKVAPDLVMTDEQGKPFTVRYEEVNAMLLNEFLKEHRTVEEEKAMIRRLESQVQALVTGLEKVSNELEEVKAAPRLAANER